MKRWVVRSWKPAIVGMALVGLLFGTVPATQAQTDHHPASGVGSCTLKGWNPATDPADAKDLPVGQRHQTYKPDDYDCAGAVFAQPGVEFANFPQPQNLQITNQRTATVQGQALPQPTAASNPLAPYFPPFQHFVVIYRENHTFDDYLGDCATTVGAGCNGQVQGTNHISSVPNLHTLAKNYALLDSYSTGTQPPSGPNHWWLFSAQSSSSSQQQAYPAASGTQFDRFLGADTGPAGEGTNACTAQTGAGAGSSPYTFVMNGDFYWMLSSGSGYWRNPATGNLEVLPVNRPGTNIPEELHYNEYTCNAQSLPDTTIANDYMNFVTTNGLPSYNYVELFNDHPGTFQDIPTNDSATNQIVNFIMGNASYKDNTLIVVTEDDTQNGNNGPDHVSNTFRVPTVVIASPTYMKQHYISHVAYTTSNVIAAMERTLQNVHSGIIDPNDNIGLTTFPMTTADQAALGDPLEDLWIQGSTPLSAAASGTPTTGNAPLNVSFTGSATGGTTPYSYSWNFGDGSAASTAQNPTHSYAAAGNYTATLTVTDSASPAHTATASVAVTVSSVGATLTASAAGNPTSGQVPLTVNFTGTATGGTPPYGYSWNFGDGSAVSTTQNPSHTYNTAGTYTATLTATDSASPTHTATATVTVTASPVAGSPPGAPTGLTASAGNAQATLSWTAPASNGGVNITGYRVYRRTTSGSETLLTAGGCSSLGAVLSCTDTGLTNGQTYFYKVSAVNAIGEGPQSNEASATPVAPSANLLGDPGFENGTSSAPWTASSGVINNGATEPPHSGSWDAWMCGYGTTHTDTLSQSVTIPSASAATLSYWRHIDTADTGTADNMKVQVLNSSGAVLATLRTYVPADAKTGYTQDTFDLTPYVGKTVTIRFTCSENSSLQTSFVLDDTSLTTSGSPPTTTTTTTPTTTTTVPVTTTTTVPPTTTTTASTTTTSTTAPGTTTTTVPGGTNLIGNPGFENGSSNPAPWTTTAGVVNNSSSEPPHSGQWDAWLDGYGTTHTDTLAQTVTIPAASSATLSFWLHVDTAETTTTTAYDTLTLQVVNSAGSVLATLRTWSNLDHNTGYSQQTLNLNGYTGQTITLRFTGSEDFTMQTSFVIDDVSLTTH